MSELKEVLARPMQERSLQGGPEDPLEGARPDPPMGAAKPRRPRGEEVNPTYLQTRVMEANPLVLKKYKIVSLFPEESLSDELKILHTQVLNGMKEIGGNSLLVTSANPREGKTTIAMNLAASISTRLDRTVLLVDADLRKPTVYRYLGLPNHGGLCDYLLRQADIPDLLFNPGIPKLVVLSGGSPVVNSSELLGSPRMEGLVEEMKARYPDRFIVIDSASLLTCADPLVLSRHVDGVLFVVESEKTPRKDLERALGLLAECRIVGTVFNKAKG